MQITRNLSSLSWEKACNPSSRVKPETERTFSTSSCVNLSSKSNRRTGELNDPKVRRGIRNINHKTTTWWTGRQCAWGGGSVLQSIPVLQLGICTNRYEGSLRGWKRLVPDWPTSLRVSSQRASSSYPGVACQHDVNGWRTESNRKS